MKTKTKRYPGESERRKQRFTLIYDKREQYWKIVFRLQILKS